MRKLCCAFLILIMAVTFVFGSMAEGGTWDCPSCGRTGNTGKFCGSCGQPKPDKAEETNPEFAPFRKMIDRLETAYAQNPMGREEIEKGLIEQFGSAEDLQALEENEVHYCICDNVWLGYWHNGNDAIYIVVYPDENGNPAYRRDYACVCDPLHYYTKEPTYIYLFEDGAKVDLVTSSSGQTYYLWHQESGDQYAETEYHDARTVTRFIVWSDTDWYKQSN